MDTLKGNRRRAKMTADTIRKELALAPTPSPSDMVPLDMIVESVPAPRSATTHAAYAHTGFELGAL